MNNELEIIKVNNRMNLLANTIFSANPYSP